MMTFQALIRAGWQPRMISVVESGIIPFIIPDGVQVWTGSKHDEAWNAAEALAASLFLAGIEGPTPTAVVSLEMV